MAQYAPHFRVEWDVPHQSFYIQLDRRMNALQLCIWRFSHKETL